MTRQQSPIAVGMAWATRISSIGLQMALPAAAGWWIDDRFGTKPIFLICGAVLGFATSMLAILRLARDSSPPSRKREK